MSQGLLDVLAVILFAGGCSTLAYGFGFDAASRKWDKSLKPKQRPVQPRRANMNVCETLKQLIDDTRAKKLDNAANLLEQAAVALGCDGAVTTQGGGNGNGPPPPK